MKNTRNHILQTRAFTLIELLVVIAIIAILAGLLLPVGRAMMQKAAISKARTAVEQIDTAIDQYKQKLGHYPPDNTNNLAFNQLYYELVGCRVQFDQNGVPTNFIPLDGSPEVSRDALFNACPGVTTIVNATAGSGSDDAAGAQQILKEVKPDFYSTGVRRLGVKVDGTIMIGELSPLRYNVTNPTNNPGKFDLWVDVVFGKKTNRISNWSKTPFVP